jgi:hypothetical protein
MNESTPEGNKKESMEIPITKEAVIDSLRQNPENVSLLASYIDAKREQFQAPYLSHEEAKRKALEFAIELAEVYKEAGLRENAWEAYNDAANVAQANGMEEEYQRILIEMGKV